MLGVNRAIPRGKEPTHGLQMDRGVDVDAGCFTVEPALKARPLTIVEETGKLPIRDGENSRPQSLIDSFLDGQTQEKVSSEETQEKRKSVCPKEDDQSRQEALPPHQGAPDTSARYYAASTANEV